MKTIVKLLSNSIEYILIMAVLIGTLTFTKLAKAEPLSHGRYVSGGIVSTIFPMLAIVQSTLSTNSDYELFDETIFSLPSLGIGQYMQGRWQSGAIVTGTQLLSFGLMFDGLYNDGNSFFGSLGGDYANRNASLLFRIGALIYFGTRVFEIADAWAGPYMDGSFEDDNHFELGIVPTRNRKTGKIGGGSLQLGMNF